MPPLALANANFGGRHHPQFRDATLATRMLASSARLISRQLFLGRGPNDEVHKGATGNSMLIAQPAPSYQQVLPNQSALTDALVVLFCKSTDDVRRAQMLVVERERYRFLVQHRQKVCPVFANVTLDHKAISALPDAAVPQFIVEAAQHVPEIEKVRTTIQGPASRIPIFSRQAEPESESDVSADEKPASSGDAHPTVTGNCDVCRPDSQGEDAHAPPEPLNEHEAFICIHIHEMHPYMSLGAQRSRGSHPAAAK